MKNVVVLVSVLLLSACSTMQPPRYSVSVDNIQHLKRLDGVKAEMASVSMPVSFSSNCRLMGPIQPADGLTIPQFVRKAFNDEFKMAEIHSNEGIELEGEIYKIEFSSVSGLTNGYWDIGLKVKSSNGHSLAVSNKYSFKSGFDAITACNATADALSPAVQDLIETTVTHPNFEALVKGG